MAVRVFGYMVCPLEFISDDNGKLSTTKIWMNIANVILSWKVIFLKDITWDIMSVYGAIVGGSYVASKFISMKFAAPQPDVTVNQPSVMNVAGDVKTKGKKK